MGDVAVEREGEVRPEERRPLRIAIFQGPERPGSPQQNLDLLARVARDAARQGARLLICPEMFLTGYNIGPAEVRRLAEPAAGPSTQIVMTIAREAGIVALYGFPERSGDGRIYNTVQLIDDDGTLLASYRKSHLFGDLERTAYTPGTDAPAVVSLGGFKIGLLICYDVEFPENARALALEGADLIAVPTALMQPFDVVARTVVPARAYENQVYVAYANRCGEEAGLVYCGLSCVVAPDGSDIARCGRGQELIVADLDRHRLEESRPGSNTYLNDRIPALYGALTAGTQTLDGKDTSP